MDRFVIRGGSPATKAGSQTSQTVESAVKRKLNSETGNDSKKAKFSDKEYDKNCRVRGFIPSWKLQFPWVVYDTDVCDKENSKGIMYCSTCRDFPEIADKKGTFFLGTSSFRIDSLRSHQKNTQHIKCEVKKKGLAKTVQQKKADVQQSPMGKAVVKMNEKKMDSLKFLFNSAYAVAKKGKPLAEYELLVEVQSKNGLDLGDNYLSSNAAKRFITSISDTIKEDFVNVLLKAPYVCILADGSTDSSVIEQEVILIRYVQSGVPTTKLVSIEALKSGTAEGVKTGIINAVESIGYNSKAGGSSFPSVIGVNFDGAAVMMGCKGGAAKLLEGSFGSHIIAIHCVADKLELGVMDAVKKDSYLAKFEETAKGFTDFTTRQTTEDVS